MKKMLCTFDRQKLFYNLRKSKFSEFQRITEILNKFVDINGSICAISNNQFEDLSKVILEYLNIEEQD
jgi:hypothetical protein